MGEHHLDQLYRLLRQELRSNLEVTVRWTSRWVGRLESIHWSSSFRGRRAGVMLALPTTADVQACVEDEDETEEDCARLVDQILEFEINHSEGWLPMTPLPIEATADSEEQQEGTSNEEQQEVTSQDGRRRLFDLLQRFQ